MRIHGVRLVYFSPTGTTRKILESVGHGLGCDVCQRLDLGRPQGWAGEVEAGETLHVIGAPVYAGRLPAEAVRRLRCLRGHGTPALIVTVYGNRAYEDALLELRDLAGDLGFMVVGAGAFIGEHSFSNASTPIAAGRPDAGDLRRAQDFGRSVAGKLAVLPNVSLLDPLWVPGHVPYREAGLAGGVSPETRETECSLCGQCVTVCPVAAIRLEDDRVVTEKARCIRCCACVKGCPPGARVVTHQGMLETARRLASTCQERKEPEVFL